MIVRKRLSILIIDGVGEKFVGWSWRAGAKIFGKMFDRVHYCASVADFWAVIESYAPGEVAHVQVWGHGGPGRPLINKVAIDDDDARWALLEGATVWFRMCSIAAGPQGHKFMKRLALHGVIPVAHLPVIGFWASQSYMVALKPGEEPWWPVDLLPKGSAPWLPRNVMAWQMTLPSWALDVAPEKFKAL